MSDVSASPSPSLTSGRLDPALVETYRREGYAIFDQPVLDPTEFAALQQCFDRILSELPATERPEALDVPHFMHPELMRWAFQDAILDLVTPLLGPDLALFSTHFICKPKGNGRRVPWHEDSAYWGRRIVPMEVCTIWLALDPSTRENGCMMVIPRTHLGERAGFSDYWQVDAERNVFPTEIVRPQRDESKRVYIELQPNHCSLHDAKIQHASEPNTSNLRRCGWTMRFCPTSVRFNQELFDGCHQVYLARGVDKGGNVYADPTRSYPEVMAKRGMSSFYRGAH